MNDFNDEVPYLTTDQMREVDRAMIEDYHIELIQMMENAGRSLAQLARERFFGGEPRGKQVIVLAGTGGNGGGALVAARHLANWGAQVQAWTTQPAARFAPVPGQQLDILLRMHVPVGGAETLPEAVAADLLVDGVIGYSLQAAPRGTAGGLIRWANEQAAPILALDAPSGVDTTTGIVHDPAIRATATMTLALPKAGLRAPGVENYVGELYLADIGVPPALFAEPGLGIQVGHIFAREGIIRLR